ncbi:CAMK protein kinase [Cryptococcus deuterogattii LA55]|nr:CAMK protein kinase [Cryptococcus deuterogattii LA55]KIR90841.1 CAMK protein kinase [Cryptococcus deuterogattii CBS 10090]
MAPGATLIFKIFLSPLDPRAEFLASQLRCFFSSPLPEDDEEHAFGQYGEFDESVGDTEQQENKKEEKEKGKRNEGKEGYDPQGRRGGVWVRKPRSSRQGSAEAFIVCRNFSPSSLPLPPTFSSSALDKLRTTPGTLTLDSLSSLVAQDNGQDEDTQVFKGSEEQVKQQWQRWRMVKAYVGGGDFSPISSAASPRTLHPQPTPVDEPPEYFSPERLHNDILFLSPTKSREHRQGQGQGGGGLKHGSLDSLSPNPSPVGDVDPTRPWTSSSPPSPSSSSSRHPTSVPPKEVTSAAAAAPSQEKISSLSVPLRLRSTSISSTISDSPYAGGGRTHPPPTGLGVITPALVSPALSSSSKTDLFFSASSSIELPTPPRALSPASALGKGHPSSSSSSLGLGVDVEERGARSATMPSGFPSGSASASGNWNGNGIPPVKLRLPPKKEKFRDTEIPPEMKDHNHMDRRGWGVVTSLGLGLGVGAGAGAAGGFEEIITSRLRSISNPIAHPPAFTLPPAPPVPAPVPLHVSLAAQKNHSEGDRDSRRPEFARTSSMTPKVRSPQTPKASLFPLSNTSVKVNTVPSVPFPASSSPPPSTRGVGDTVPVTPPPQKMRRKESQQLEREHRQAGVDESVKAGDVIKPCLSNASAADVGEHEGGKGKEKGGISGGGWRLVRKMGEGAFSAVWSAVPAAAVTTPPSPSAAPTDSPTPTNLVVALKLLTHPLPDPRTRIAFLREASVLRHISHPSIVGYIDNFSTERHDVLVLEAAGGGELFELMSDEENRRRMILPAPEPEPVAAGSGSEESEMGWDKDGEGFVRRVFSELVKAVGWLHEVGVVHRDIKLENILFTTNPFLLPPTSTSSIPLHLLPPAYQPLIKLTDFGLSRFISPASPLLYTRCGSECFAAPEIIMGKPYDGRETDAWALGVVLYGLIVGELPFDREENMTLPEGVVTPGGRNSERERGRKKMHRIAKGEYTWPTPEPAPSQDIPGAYVPGTATPSARAVISSLLQRNPTKRAKPSDLWVYDWMLGPGAVPQPVEGAGTPQQEGVEDDKRRDASGRGRRRVLDGFLVEEEGIEDVAMTEH